MGNKAKIIFEVFEHSKGFLLKAYYENTTLEFIFPSMEAVDMFIQNFAKSLEEKEGVKGNPLISQRKANQGRSKQ